MKNAIIKIISALSFIGCHESDKNNEFSSFENAPVTISSDMVINDSVIDADNVQAVIDPLWHTADIYQSEQLYEESLKPFTSNQRYVFAIQWYMAEVNNGGHAQFFTNSTGIVWKDALEGFKKTGLMDYYLNLKKAADLFPGGPSLDREKRQLQFDKLGSDLSGFDDRFYELDKKAPLEGLLMEFIKKNRKDFYFKGKVSRPFLSVSHN